MKTIHWIAVAIIAGAVVQPLSAQDVRFRTQSEFKTSGAPGQAHVHGQPGPG